MMTMISILPSADSIEGYNTNTPNIVIVNNNNNVLHIYTLKCHHGSLII